jgi:hypothetical protein
MSNADAKKAAFAALAFRTASSGSLTDDVRTAIAESAGFTTWPPSVGQPIWEVKDLLNDMGYELAEDMSITRNTTTYPTTIGPDASAHICTILYLATLNPGDIYSEDALRNALWGLLS